MPGYHACPQSGETPHMNAVAADYGSSFVAMALELPLGGHRRTLWDIEDIAEIGREPIAFDEHCYGCTAGAGSSRGGALT